MYYFCAALTPCVIIILDNNKHVYTGTRQNLIMVSNIVFIGGLQILMQTLLSAKGIIDSAQALKR